MKYDSAINNDKQGIHAVHRQISQLLCRAKEARYKRVHSILLHLYEVQGKTKQNYFTVIKIQNTGLLGGKVDALIMKSTHQGTFRDDDVPSDLGGRDVHMSKFIKLYA